MGFCSNIMIMFSMNVLYMLAALSSFKCSTLSSKFLRFSKGLIQLFHCLINLFLENWKLQTQDAT